MKRLITFLGKLVLVSILEALYPVATRAQANLAFCTTNSNPCTFWAYTPGAIANARKGSILVHNAGGPIAAILDPLGQKYTHTGMLTSNDGSVVSHNSFDESALANDDNLDIDINWYPPGAGTATIKPMKLWNGLPGLHTAWVTLEATPGMTYISKPIQLHPYWVTTDWAFLEPTADISMAVYLMREMKKYYRLHGFMDQAGEWGRGIPGDYIGGGHCSGTVFQALGRNDTRTYTDEQVHQAAESLYNYIVEWAHPIVSGKVTDYLNGFNFIVSDGMVQNITAGIANQVVNCFYFGDTLAPGGGCRLPSQYGGIDWYLEHCRNPPYCDWRYGTDTAHAVSPDDLVIKGYAGPNYPYAWEDPVNETGNTYLNRNPQWIDPQNTEGRFDTVTVYGKEASAWKNTIEPANSYVDEVGDTLYRMIVTFQNKSGRIWGDPSGTGFYVIRYVNSENETVFGTWVPDDRNYYRLMNQNVGYLDLATFEWDEGAPPKVGRRLQMAWCDGAGKCWPFGAVSPPYGVSAIITIINSILE